jgi:hypothetical protein
MRLVIISAIASIAVAIGWIIYGRMASRPLGPTGAALTQGASVVMAVLSVLAVWLVAFIVWTINVYRRSRPRDISHTGPGDPTGV